MSVSGAHSPGAAAARRSKTVVKGEFFRGPFSRAGAIRRAKTLVKDEFFGEPFLRAGADRRAKTLAGNENSVNENSEADLWAPLSAKQDAIFSSSVLSAVAATIVDLSPSWPALTRGGLPSIIAARLGLVEL